MTHRELERLVAPVEAALGRELSGVSYWCLLHERTDDAVRAAKFFHGGFTALDFAGAALLLSWSDEAAWPDMFSLTIEARAVPGEAVEGYHERFDATSAALWAPHAGTVLRWARLLAWNGTPHVLELGFPNGAVVVADGYEEPLGDGDDIVHWPADEFWAGPADGLETLWRSAEAPSALPRS